jgi:protein ImuB
MRVLALSFPQLAFELQMPYEAVRPKGKTASRPSPQRAAPAAVVLLDAALQDSSDAAKLTGATRLSQVNAAARALGLVAGMTLARAKAQVAHLEVKLLGWDLLTQRLRTYAEIMLRFGATVAIHLDDRQAIVWVDITGCAHLFGGEAGLVREALATFGQHEVYAAIAEGPRLAALATFLHRSKLGTVSVYDAYDGLAARAASVPILPAHPDEVRRTIGALPLGTVLPERLLATFSRLGLHTLEHLMVLPSHELAARLRDLRDLKLRARTSFDPQALLCVLSGVDRTPLTPYVPPELPVESWDLEHELCDASQAHFLLRPLCERLVARVQAKGLALAALQLVLGKARHLVRFPHPTARAEDVLVVLKSKLDTLSLAEPVRTLALESVQLAAPIFAETDLFDRRARAGQGALALLVAELSASMGPEQVGKLSVRDTWDFRARSQLVPVDVEAEMRLDGYVVEPTRLVADAPFSVATEGGDRSRQGVLVRHVGRVEGHAWWRGVVERSDFYVAERDGQVPFVERRLAGAGASVAYVIGYVD